MPKMIERCIECAHYSKKSHKCKVCKSKETDPRDPFFDDCPLPDAEPVRHGRWVPLGGTLNVQCSECKAVRNTFSQVYWSYCPNCGNPMDGCGIDEG